MLPEARISLLLFILIAGPGILLSYRRRDMRSALWGLAVAGLAYFGVRVLYFRDVLNDALLFDSFKAIVPIAVLGTLAIAWLGRKRLARDVRTSTAFFKLAFYSLLIVTPFIIGGLHDYNVRADTSSPREMILEIVDKWIDSDSDAWMTLETPDGVQFTFSPTWEAYNEHDVGYLLEVEVHQGALGYPWFAWDRPAVRWLKEEANAIFVGIVIVAALALVYHNKSKGEARKRAHWITRYVDDNEKIIVSLIIKSCLALLIFAVLIFAIATGGLQIMFIILGISLMILFMVKRRRPRPTSSS